MTAERCPTCDQPGGTYKESVSGPPTPVCSYECLSNAIDWRARALAAEASLEQLVGTEAEAAELATLMPAGACGTFGPTAAEMDALFADRFGVKPRLYYSQRLYLREAEDIARRALVEGLAECERLRDVWVAAVLWSIQDRAGRDNDRACSDHPGGRRGCAACALHMVVERSAAPAYVNAIRADAAREERERVVAYAIECAGRCNTLSERHLFLAFADALNDGDHAKGGR